MKNKAFTLVELLAVIVVLAIILAISIPLVANIFGSATKNAFASDAKLVIRGIEYQRLNDGDFDITTIDETNVESILKISDDNYQSIEVSELNGHAHVIIVGKNKWANLIAHGTFKTMVVENVTDYSPDETPPVLTLLGDNPITVAKGVEYVDAGATATDDTDGDITNDIIVTNNVDYNTTGVYTVIYAVEDSSGNEAEPIARIVYVSNEVPILTLLGENPVTIKVGDTYTDAGATAYDNEEGDISNIIEMTSTLNSNVAGTYTVTYNVTDSSGNNAAPVTRTIYVVDIVYTFTNAEQTGPIGPSQAQLDTAYLGTSLEGKVTSSSGIQNWKAPATGTYRIETWGAQGSSPNGDYGAYARGDFELIKGERLKILVGQMGEGHLAGGGGTYVAKVVSSSSYQMLTGEYVTPLIVAGGGAGGGVGLGTYSSSPVGGFYIGGGGFQTNGQYMECGKSFLNGGQGGSGTDGCYDGGFGGGAGCDYNDEDDSGGGGGGYQGGDGGTNSYGFGGYSYNAGSNRTSSSGVKEGHGQVKVTFID